MLTPGGALERRLLHPTRARRASRSSTSCGARASSGRRSWTASPRCSCASTGSTSCARSSARRTDWRARAAGPGRAARAPAARLVRGPRLAGRPRLHGAGPRRPRPGERPRADRGGVRRRQRWRGGGAAAEGRRATPAPGARQDVGAGSARKSAGAPGPREACMPSARPQRLPRRPLPHALRPPPPSRSPCRRRARDARPHASAAGLRPRAHLAASGAPG